MFIARETNNEPKLRRSGMFAAVQKQLLEEQVEHHAPTELKNSKEPRGL